MATDSSGNNYTITILLPPTGLANLEPTSINDSGQIIGFDSFTTAAFLYSNGNYTILSDPLATLYTTTVVAGENGINSSGQIVGSFGNPPGTSDPGTHSFLYSAGTYIAIPDAPSSQGNTSAIGVNDSGQVLLYSGNLEIGYVYSAGTYTPIQPTAGALTRVEGINNSGQVVGFFLSGTFHGFIESGGNYTILPANYIALGINNAGQVVGEILDSTGAAVHGFVESGGTFTTIDFPGATNTNITGINQSGEIVGWYRDSSGYTHGFVESGGNYAAGTAGTFTTIDPWAGYTYLTGINSAGEVIGYYYSSGNQVAFMASPDALFTSGAETVNFNSLTPDQIAAVNAGADLYNALGGGDTITLPDAMPGDESAAIAGTTKTFDLTQVFSVGDSPSGVTTNIFGGSGSYDIKLGSGLETVSINGNGDSHIVAGGNADNITVTGSGTNSIEIANGASAQVQSNSSTNTVQFDGSSGWLKLANHGAGFLGTINGMSGSDGIDILQLASQVGSNSATQIGLPEIAFQFSAQKGDVLLYENNQSVTELQFDPNTPLDQLIAKPDGTGGTDLLLSNAPITAYQYIENALGADPDYFSDTDAPRAEFALDQIIDLREENATISSTDTTLRDAEYWLRGYLGGLTVSTGSGDLTDLGTIENALSPFILNSYYLPLKAIKGILGQNVSGPDQLPATPIGGYSANIAGYQEGIQNLPIQTALLSIFGVQNIDSGPSINPTDPIKPALDILLPTIGNKLSTWVVDAVSNTMQLFDPDGDSTYAFGITGNTVTQLNISATTTSASQFEVSAAGQIWTVSAGQNVDFGALGVSNFTIIQPSGGQGDLVVGLNFAQSAETIVSELQPTIAISIDPAVIAAGQLVLAGHASDSSSSITNIEIYAGTTDLGAATVASGGAWSFTTSSPTTSADFQVVVTDAAGATWTAGANLTYANGSLLEQVNIDNGGNTVSTIVFNSSVQDGYISGATVFADAHGTGQLASDDVSTTTDAIGSFSLSNGSGPLVAFGGTDTSTGLQFKGQLSAPAGSTEITPLTTLLTDLAADPSAQTKVLSAFSLSASLDLTTFDPIAAAQSGNADGAAAEVAGAKVYDTVSLIASALVGAGGSFAPSSEAAFAEIAAAIDGPGVSLNSQSDVSSLITSIAKSESLILAKGVADSVAAIVVATNTELDQKLQADGSGNTLLNDTAAVERVVQGIASNAVEEASNDSAQVQALVGAFTSTNLDTAVTGALTHLGTINDTTPPTLTSVANQTDEATGPQGAVATFSATATDSVDGVVPVVFKEGNTVVHSGDTFALGSHTITASGVDASGNQSSETFTINIVDTTPPVLTPVADETIHATSAAGAAVVFSVSAADAVDGTDQVVFTENNTVVHSGGIFALGNHTITATATDAAGNSSSENFIVKVADQAPVVAALSGSVGEDGPTFSQNLLADTSDPDSDTLTIAGLDASVTTTDGRALVLGTDYTLSGSSIELTSAGFAKFNSLTASQTDHVVFHYSVSDSILTTADSLTLTVDGANDAPVVADQTHNQSVTAGTSFSLTLPADTFQDPDSGDHLALTASLSNGNPLPSWITFDATADTLKGTPSASSVGSIDISIKATDTGGLSATDTFELSVIGRVGHDHAPVITSDGGGARASVIISDDTKYVDKVTATDPDPGTTLKYSIIGGEDQKLFKINPTTGDLSFKSLPKAGHSYQVEVAASDGTKQDTQTIDVQVAKGIFEFGHKDQQDNFVFKPGFGLDIVNNFDPKSSNHDVLELDHNLFHGATAGETGSALLSLIDHHSFQFGPDVFIVTNTHDVIDLEKANLHSLAAKDFMLT